jgi:hypothetical protein
MISSQFRLCLLCLFVALLFLSSAQAQSGFRPLTVEEKRGKALYRRGESASGQEITALLNDLDVPASTLTCAGCHGSRGEGKTEGGVTAGNLVWSNLTKSYGHTHDNGRKHGAFTETSFVRALTAGVDPSGNKFSVAMPAYRMPQQDMTDLLAYLKRIDTDLDPGVSDDKIVIGTLLPEKPAPELVPVGMKDRVFFAFPTVPADVTAAGAAEYSGLLQRNKLSSTHAAAQASAIAAAKILVYALERCGKDLTREQLITTLEGLYEFDTGLMPKLTYGPNRRIGALGAYVVTIDPEKKLFPASVEWVPAE